MVLVGQALIADTMLLYAPDVFNGLKPQNKAL